MFTLAGEGRFPGVFKPLKEALSLAPVSSELTGEVSVAEEDVGEGEPPTQRWTRAGQTAPEANTWSCQKPREAQDRVEQKKNPRFTVRRWGGLEQTVPGLQGKRVFQRMRGNRNNTLIA